MVSGEGLKKRISGDITQAMKSGDTVKRSALRFLMAAINNVEKTQHKELSDADVLGIIAKEAKRVQESIEAFQQGNRQDLVAKEQVDLAIMQEYLPEQMSREQVADTARRIIGEMGAQGVGDKGKVMSMIIPELKGKADGKEINEVVTELLTS
ncbi:GatB/YqeY domain-containing protein [Chloroflexota bacterium]